MSTRVFMHDSIGSTVNARESYNSNSSWFCHRLQGLKSRGVFYHDNPLEFGGPLLLAQLSISALLSAFAQFILTPLGESAFVSHMLVGILMGPTIWGKNNTFLGKLFPRTSFYVNETFGFFGCMLFMFLVGVRMDLGMISRTGRKAVAIGVFTVLFPVGINMVMASLLKKNVKLDPGVEKSLYFMAALQCISSFHVIGCVLADLKLLNSELGRLAASSSMISGIATWIWMVVGLTIRQSKYRGSTNNSLPWMFFSAMLMLMTIVCILRPIMHWMIRQTSEGKPIKESYIFYIFLMMLGCAFFSEIIGQHFMFGPIILGVALPDGPPLGSALVNKLESFVSSILLPTFFVFTGAGIDLASIHGLTFSIVELLALCSFVGKLLGTMLPSLYSKMSLMDAFSLGLIMSVQGITDVLMLQQAALLYIVDKQSYSMMLASMVLLTGTITPIVKFIYNPSKQYMSSKKRTIQQAASNSELRLLSCIYHQDNTPSMINLLKLSHPTTSNPICFYIVHLIELAGRLSPLLIYHRPDNRDQDSFQYSNQSDHIIKAFRQFELQKRGTLMVNLFTAVSPYATMHDEICTLALEKRVSMVILPFHKQWSLHGTEEFANQRIVNRNIIRKAPCSIGIFVDKRTLGVVTSVCRNFYNIGLIFIGGSDDREALALATRMSNHPDVAVTVIRVIDMNGKRSHSLERELDSDTVAEFKGSINNQKHHIYKEQLVNDSVDLVGVVRSVENSFHLIMVGRYHSSESPLFMRLTEWNEFPELGYLGDMLVASDSECEASVLVVQQQKIAGDVGSVNHRHLVDEFAVASTPRFNAQVWPLS
ncbi:cation/H(+) antiporter 15-like [Tripterygium wilfordii]|uniref:Cation/H(+) antiporter 15-like n=2 Tax=Tripterygium wilfordii TaxID=458696 RepID=A0A7J7DDN3_TRIWF|nr:cation/H(+) antiporter 15-like [Tripterygium wilfordii]